MTQLLLPAADASELSYPREQPRAPGNTSPAPRAVNSPRGNAVGVLSPSFLHLPATPAQGLVWGQGGLDATPLEPLSLTAQGSCSALWGVPMALPEGTVAGPIFGIGIKMVSSVLPTPVCPAQPQQSRTP